MSRKYILALDQGTTSSRAVIFDHKANKIAVAQKEFRQIFPKGAYVEHDPMDILSSQLVNSISSYDKAISLYPYMGDAYFNRGLVLIYLKDKEKGCIDLSRAGEMGVRDAYSVISKYCEKEENR